MATSIRCVCQVCSADYIVTFRNTNGMGHPEHCASCGTLASFDMFDINDEGTDIMTKTTTDLIRQWAHDRNLHTADPKGQALKLGEEFGELFEGMAKDDEDLIKDAIGDMYVVMTILSEQLGFTIEECIEIAYAEIKDRKGRMVDGVFIKEADLKEDD